MRNISDVLGKKSLTELRAIAKKLNLSGFSHLRKADLIARLQTVDELVIREQLFPTWWQKHHNHAYGTISVLGVALSIAFFLWPTDYDLQRSTESHLQIVVNENPRTQTIEKPISFGDFASLSPEEKDRLFESRKGQEFVWEGFLAKTIGFELDTLTGVPFDTPISVAIKPTQSRSPQIIARCDFGEIVSTDSGVELALQLHLLEIGQRIRLSGKLGGTPEIPILHEAFLEAVFPVGE